MNSVTKQPSSAGSGIMQRLHASLSDQSGQLLQQGLGFNNGQSTSQQQANASKATLSTTQKLDLLEQVLNQVDAKPAAVATKDTSQANQFSQTTTQPQDSLSQAAAQAVIQATDTLNPQISQPAGKEKLDQAGPDSTALEAGSAITLPEEEKSPEISPEVEKFIKTVEEEKQGPEEVVVAEQAGVEPVATNYAAQPVVVIPITPEIEKKGARKSPKFSLRWLVEWSQKIMKMFAGKVVYRQA